MTKNHKEMISREVISRMARLARLDLDASEMADYENDLETILSHFEKINTFDTSDDEPAYHPHDYENKLREDISVPARPAQDWLTLAKKTKDGSYMVPKTVE